MKTIASTSKVYARTSADSYSLIYSRSITAKNTTENIWSWSIPTKYRNAKLKVVVSATFKKSGYSAGRTSTKYYWESVPAVSPE